MNRNHKMRDILTQKELNALLFALGTDENKEKESQQLNMYNEPPELGPKPNDPVNHPSHYTSGKYEVIDIIEDQLGLDGLVGFCLGNTIKYICRAGKKGEDEKYLEDLKKAKWYLNRVIERKGQPTNEK